MGLRPRRQQLRQMPFDKAGVDLVARHLRQAQQVLQQVQIAGHAFKAEFAQGAIGAAQRGRIAGGMDDELGQQRVIAGVRSVPGITVTVHPQAGAAGRLVGTERAQGRSGAAVRSHAFQVDTQLQCTALRLRRLQQVQIGQGVARGQPDLRLHQIHSSHRLGDGVLDLDARIGFHEIERARPLRVEQELEGAQAAVFHRARQLQGGGDDALAQRAVQVRAGRDLDQLLPASLQAALALP